MFSEGRQLHCRGWMIGFLPTGDVVDCGPKCFGIPSISMKLVLKIDVFKLSIKVVGSVPQLSVTKNKILLLMVSFLNPSVQTLLLVE